MDEKVNINFIMNITNDEKKYEVQFNENGKRYYRNEKIFISFKEPLMEEDKYNHLLFICDKDELQIIRNGHVQMKQKYRENETTYGYYNNEYLHSEIATFTNRYEYNNDIIYLNYDILIDNNIIGNYEMKVMIKGVDEDE